MTEPAFESALAVLVPEAEALVQPFRLRHDPSAAVGMPAHITVNYPFLQVTPDDSVVIDALRELFQAQRRFRISLASLERFPAVLYLAPEPAQPLSALIDAVAQRFPEAPPYGGAFEQVIPHLTVAHVEAPAQLDQIATEFAAAARGQLPIIAPVDKVWLMDDREGRWQQRTSFALSD